MKKDLDPNKISHKKKLVQIQKIFWSGRKFWVGIILGQKKLLGNPLDTFQTPSGTLHTPSICTFQTPSRHLANTFQVTKNEIQDVGQG